MKEWAWMMMVAIGLIGSVAGQCVSSCPGSGCNCLDLATSGNEATVVAKILSPGFVFVKYPGKGLSFLNVKVNTSSGWGGATPVFDVYIMDDIAVGAMKGGTGRIGWSIKGIGKTSLVDSSCWKNFSSAYFDANSQNVYLVIMNAANYSGSSPPENSSLTLSITTRGESSCGSPYNRCSDFTLAPLPCGTVVISDSTSYAVDLAAGNYQVEVTTVPYGKTPDLGALIMNVTEIPNICGKYGSFGYTCDITPGQAASTCNATGSSLFWLTMYSNSDPVKVSYKIFPVGGITSCPPTAAPTLAPTSAIVPTNNPSPSPTPPPVAPVSSPTRSPSGASPTPSPNGSPSGSNPTGPTPTSGPGPTSPSPNPPGPTVKPSRNSPTNQPASLPVFSPVPPQDDGYPPVYDPNVPVQVPVAFPTNRPSRPSGGNVATNAPVGSPDGGNNQQPGDGSTDEDSGLGSGGKKNFFSLVFDRI